MLTESHWSDKAECESPDYGDGRDTQPACVECGRAVPERELDGHGLCVGCGRVATDYDLRAEAGVW